VSRAVHCSSGVLLVLAALLLCGGGPASAATAPPARWTEAKAETRIEHGTYRVVDKGEVFWANNGVLSLRPTLAQARAQGGPQRVIDLLAAQLAAAEVKLAQAEAGRALTLASCKGTYGRKLGPANGFGSYRIPTYTRFRCEATVVGRT
jgi:hypothetical protein